jgi:hypothetical protein
MKQNYDIIPIPISIRGCDGRYVYVNKAWCEMFSLDIENALGFKDTELNLDPLAFPEGEPGSSAGEYSFRDVFITTKEKGKLLLELIETRVDEIKGPSRIMCVHQDMTGMGWRMEDLTRNLQRSESRAKQNTQQIMKLVRENAEPVIQILTFCDRMQNTKLDNKQNGMLAIISDNARILQKNMQIDTGTSGFDKNLMATGDASVLLEPMIVEIIKLYKNVARDKNITIEARVSDDLGAPVFTDRAHLRQILINMIESAIRGSGNGRILVQAQLIRRSKTPLFFKVMVENPKTYEKGHVNLCDLGLGLSHKILRGLCGIVGGRLEISHESNGSNTLKVYLRATTNGS